MDTDKRKTVQGLQLISLSMVAFSLFVLAFVLTLTLAASLWMSPSSAENMAGSLRAGHLVSGLAGVAYLLLMLAGKIQCRRPDGPGKNELLLSITFDLVACLMLPTPLRALAPLPALVGLLAFLGYLYRLGEANSWDWLQKQSKTLGIVLAAAYGLGIMLGPFGSLLAVVAAVGSAVSLYKLLKRVLQALA